MKCEVCNHWQMDIPCGTCNHPEGNYQGTNDRMVFEYVTTEECPRVRNMENLLSNLIRYDFQENIGGLIEEKTVLFNKKDITTEQVEHLVEIGLYEHDSRLIVTTPGQFENVMK